MFRHKRDLKSAMQKKINTEWREKVALSAKLSPSASKMKADEQINVTFEEPISKEEKKALKSARKAAKKEAKKVEKLL